MEKVIRDVGGCENFVATITYPDTSTQIHSHYHFAYILNGENVVDDFDNINSDEVNNAQSTQQANEQQTQTTESTVIENTNTSRNNDLLAIDTNGNGQVTIQEAKAAGFAMPIYSEH